MKTTFSFKTIKNFDNHIKCSVPSYTDIQDLILSLSTYYIKDNSTVLDLGCSTGDMLNKINKYYNKDSINYIGYEIEDNIINKDIFKKNLSYINGDILVEELPESDFILSMFTLQFIDKKERLKLLKKINRKNLGAFILVEKTVAETGYIQDLFTFSYYDYKSKTFLAEDILEKQRALRKIMNPLTIKENEGLLKKAGFKNIVRFYQSLSFVGWICDTKF